MKQHAYPTFFRIGMKVFYLYFPKQTIHTILLHTENLFI